MKVVIELSPTALRVLKKKAGSIKRSRKNYMEFVLTSHAALISNGIPTPYDIDKETGLINNPLRQIIDQ